MHKIKRSHLYIAILLISILEATLLNNIKLINVQPDLLLILVLFSSLFFDRRTALEAGIAAGLLRDLLSFDIFGLNLILFGLIAFFTNLFADKVYKSFFLAQVFLTLIAGTAFYLSHLTARLMAGRMGISTFGEGFFWVVIPAVLYTSLAAPLIFFVLRRIFRRTKRMA